MSEADAFRKSNKEFWSKMEQKGNAQRGHRFEGEKARQAPIKFSRAVLRAAPSMPVVLSKWILRPSDTIDSRYRILDKVIIIQSCVR